MDILDVKDVVLRRLYNSIDNGVIDKVYAIVKGADTEIVIVLSDEVDDATFNFSRSFATLFADINELTIITRNSFNFFRRPNHLLFYDRQSCSG